MQNSIISGGLQAISWLIFPFGVVNLINTTLSNQMSRKRENSILRSIGLTRKQLRRMNICESLCYAAFAALAALLAGLPMAVVVCREVSRQSFAGEIVPYQFPGKLASSLLSCLDWNFSCPPGRPAGRGSSL